MPNPDHLPKVLLYPRWNLHPKAVTRHRSADAFVASIPKSGRTWVRVFVQAYSHHLDGQAFSLSTSGFRNQAIPRVLFTHDLFSNVTDRRLLRRLAGVHLIPRSLRHTRPVVLLCRDPRDVAVSLYFQLTKRKAGVQAFEGTMAQMLRDPAFGLERTILVMNSWLNEWTGSGNMMLLRYEDCRTDPAPHFAELLRFVGHPSIDQASFEHALAFASFENMRLLEAQTSANDARPALRPRSGADPDSFKVRRGIVGGYASYLDDDDLRFVNHALKSLNPRFGYLGE